MKNFNDYFKREDFSILRNFFMDKGHLKTIKKMDYFVLQGYPTACAASAIHVQTKRETSILSVIHLPGNI